MSTFISYSRADSSFAIRLAKDLKSAGFNVWLDQLDIPTGARWDDEVETALESCKIFMIILSPESLQSQNVKDEIGYAIDSGKHLLPVKIKSGEIPFRLRRFQYVDFSKQSYSDSLKEIKGLLSAPGSLPETQEFENDISAAEERPTQKRVQAVAAGSPTPRTTMSRGLLIGLVAVALLAISAIIFRSLGAERSAATAPPIETALPESHPTERATVEATPDTSQVSAPVASPQPAAFLATFTKSKDLDAWESVVLGLGRKNKVKVSPSNDGLMFHLDDPDLHAYYFYKSESYDDIAIRMKAENLGQNTYKVSLVCRRTDDTWYEFMILGGGLWQLYDYRGEYIPVVNGGTQAIKPGKSINEYEMLCIGNKISLRINGELVTTEEIQKNVYPQGQVGLSVTADQVYPIDIKVMEFEISKPHSGPAAPVQDSSSTAASPANEQTQISQKDGMTMVFVPEGEFTMGSDAGEPNEKPVHTVFLNAFWIDQTEVTNAMFATFLNAEASGSNSISKWIDVEDADIHVHLVDNSWQVDPGYEDQPAIEMKWAGASAYCEWRGEGTRLPTEAEWEKAARGTTDNLYPWGNQISCDLANYAECKGTTVAVGSYPSNASPYGALDMTGNVMEWVADWYGEGYYQNSTASNPTGPDSGESRVLRGGSWDGHTDYQVRTTYRFEETPDSSKDDAGFRCVVPE